MHHVLAWLALGGANRRLLGRGLGRGFAIANGVKPYSADRRAAAAASFDVAQVLAWLALGGA